MDEIKLKPIGYVSSSITERVDENWGEAILRIVLRPKYAGALSGLEDFCSILAIVHELKLLPMKPKSLLALTFQK